MNDLCPTCYQILPPGMDGLRVCLDENCLIWNRTSCQLTAREAEIASILIGAGRGWVSSERIVCRIYGAMDIPLTAIDVLRVHIARIRRKMREADIPATIENSWYQGHGGHRYRLKWGYD